MNIKSQETKIQLLCHLTCLFYEYFSALHPYYLIALSPYQVSDCKFKNFATSLPSSIPLLILTCDSLHLAVNTRDWTFTSYISAMPVIPKKGEYLLRYSPCFTYFFIYCTCSTLLPTIHKSLRLSMHY